MGWFEGAVDAVRRGGGEVLGDVLAGRSCSATQAGQLIVVASRADEGGGRVRLTGEIVGDLELGDEVRLQSLTIDAAVKGSVSVRGPVAALAVTGAIEGSFTWEWPEETTPDATLFAAGEIGGDLRIGGAGSGSRVSLFEFDVGGDVVVTDRVRLRTLFTTGGTVEGEIRVEGEASVSQHLGVDRTAVRDVTFTDRGRVEGTALVSLDVEQGGRSPSGAKRSWTLPSSSGGAGTGSTSGATPPWVASC